MSQSPLRTYPGLPGKHQEWAQTLTGDNFCLKLLEAIESLPDEAGRACVAHVLTHYRIEPQDRRICLHVACKNDRPLAMERLMDGVKTFHPGAPAQNTEFMRALFETAAPLPECWAALYRWNLRHKGQEALDQAEMTAAAARRGAREGLMLCLEGAQYSPSLFRRVYATATWEATLNTGTDMLLLLLSMPLPVAAATKAVLLGDCVIAAAAKREADKILILRAAGADMNRNAGEALLKAALNLDDGCINALLPASDPAHYPRIIRELGKMRGGEPVAQLLTQGMARAGEAGGRNPFFFTCRPAFADAAPPRTPPGDPAPARADSRRKRGNAAERTVK